MASRVREHGFDATFDVRGRIVDGYDDRDVCFRAVDTERHDATDFAEPRHRDVRRVNCGDSRMAKADSARRFEKRFAIAAAACENPSRANSAR